MVSEKKTDQSKSEVKDKNAPTTSKDAKDAPVDPAKDPKQTAKPVEDEDLVSFTILFKKNFYFLKK